MVQLSTIILTVKEVLENEAAMLIMLTIDGINVDTLVRILKLIWIGVNIRI